MVRAFLPSLFLLSAFARQPLQSGLEGENIRLFVIVFYLTAKSTKKIARFKKSPFKNLCYLRSNSSFIKFLVIVNKSNFSGMSHIHTQIENIKTIVMSENIVHLLRLDAFL